MVAVKAKKARIAKNKPSTTLETLLAFQIFTDARRAYTLQSGVCEAINMTLVGYEVVSYLVRDNQ